MRLKRTVLTSIGVAAVAVALGAAPAQADKGDKPDGAVRLAGQDATAADARASRAAAVAVADNVARASTDVQARIVEFVRTHGTKYTFGAFTDPASGKVVVQSDAPAEVLAALTGTATAAAPVEVRKEGVTEQFSRRDDVPSFWGGAGITTVPGSPHCSAGYTVRNSAGTRYMVTAGHCFSNGQTAFTEIGGRTYGVASGNGLPTQDMVLLGGQSYSPFIYIGGVNSSSGAHVASAADPIVGFNNYCHSGRTTGEHCGHTVTDVNALVCTSSGCKQPVIAYTGGTLPQGGDSGAPFYANSVSAPDKHIRGHHIAGGGGVSYAEKYSRVTARFGVTIVT
ncbi:MAG TPA: hypothetical protein VFV67_18640 [Actinophytocola sp.]|uniref:hypothetical protein n=1 Tax=Actinophytocola sp. TaxID=1872138 RepID=UPI002DB9BA1D|nr:hypothetical protein [Actinophytocola sp.]HEU5472669.1 hypothetical protein [Actinophytocola sp.]